MRSTIKKRNQTKTILSVLTVLAWIIFISMCIVAGSFIVNILFVMVNPEGFKYVWKEADLTALLQYNRTFFFVQILTITVVILLKAVLFYIILKMLSLKSLSISKPFHSGVRGIIFSSSIICLLIGMFSAFGTQYAKWLSKKGVLMPTTEEMYLAGADVWLFMCVILYIIVQVIKRGIELQSENELTI